MGGQSDGPLTVKQLAPALFPPILRPEKFFAFGNEGVAKDRAYAENLSADVFRLIFGELRSEKLPPAAHRLGRYRLTVSPLTFRLKFGLPIDRLGHLDSPLSFGLRNRL